MIPVYLDPAHARIALIGRGELAVRRLAWLQAGGAEPDVWGDGRLPRADEISGYHAVWIAGLSAEEAAPLAHAARAAGVLVNVEDQTALCDFHTPAVVRRGKLTLTSGTGGASPAVARAARERLEAAFPEAWGKALEEIAQSRAALRERKADFDTLINDARVRLAQHGLS
ncbi:MAG: NAD(P)-dependent oxidoreductase [Hyphomonadaceae bacterium]